MEHAKRNIDWQLDQLTKIETLLKDSGLEATRTGPILHFYLNKLAGHEDWNAIGRVFFLPYLSSRDDEEILQLQLIVARNANPELGDELNLCLHRLNMLAMFGRFFVDEKHQLIYHHRIPVVVTPEQTLTQTFEFSLFEMVRFLDQFYPYLLTILSDPHKLTLKEYMEKYVINTELFHTQEPESDPAEETEE